MQWKDKCNETKGKRGPYKKSHRKILKGTLFFLQHCVVLLIRINGRCKFL